MSQQPILIVGAQSQSGGQQQSQARQMAERFGGGGGGGRRGDGPRGFEPKELAYLFRLLAKASGQLFTETTRFLLTEESAHDLLTGTFEALADATEQGELVQVVEGIVKGAEEQRAIATRRIVGSEKHWVGLPVFTESEGRDVVKKIKGCLKPRGPR